MLLPAERLALSGLIGWIAVADDDPRRRRRAGADRHPPHARLSCVISGIGVMLAGLALGDAAGLSGAILYAVHSMLVMTALYLLAGMIRDVGGCFSLDDLGRALSTRRRCLPALALLLFLRHCRPAARLRPVAEGRCWSRPRSMPAQGWLAAAILVSGLLTTIAFGRVFLLAFWRTEPPVRRGQSPGAGRHAIAYAALLVLLLGSLAIGLYPEPFIGSCRSTPRPG